MRARKIYEVQNFQRGLDPKTSLGIGKSIQRDFPGGKELIEWAYNFPAVWSKGEIQEWKDSDYIIRKPLDGYLEEVYIQRMRNIKLIVVKWIKDNITINGEPLSLKESINMFEEIQRFVIQELEKARGLRESYNFERGIDPKSSLDIGLAAKRDFDTVGELVEWLYMFPNIWTAGRIPKWDNPEKVTYYRNNYSAGYSVERIADEKLTDIKWIKDNIRMRYNFFKGEAYNDYCQIGLKEAKMASDQLEAKFIEMHKNGLKENQHFERGQDPKRTLGIGDMGKADMMNGMSAFTHFLYHIDPHFIEKIWGDTMIGRHLKSKWAGILSRAREDYMDPNSIMKFIRELDTENEKLLFQYIIENHSDKW